MAFGTTYDGMDARQKLVFVKGLRHVIIGTEAETLDLVLDAHIAR